MIDKENNDTKYPLKDGIFDAVICSDFFENTDDDDDDDKRRNYLVTSFHEC